MHAAYENKNWLAYMHLEVEYTMFVHVELNIYVQQLAIDTYTTYIVATIS